MRNCPTHSSMNVSKETACCAQGASLLVTSWYNSSLKATPTEVLLSKHQTLNSFARLGGKILMSPSFPPLNPGTRDGSLEGKGDGFIAAGGKDSAGTLGLGLMVRCYFTIA